MWSGFFAGILAAVVEVVWVVRGWFFNQSGKGSAIRKALQLEIEADWQRLEHLRKAVRPGNLAGGLDQAGDFSALEGVLKRNLAVVAGWQRSVWTSNLVEIVSTLRAGEVKRLQNFYMALERLDSLAQHHELAEAVKTLFQLFREEKPKIGTAQGTILSWVFSEPNRFRADCTNLQTTRKRAQAASKRFSGADLMP